MLLPHCQRCSSSPGTRPPVSQADNAHGCPVGAHQHNGIHASLHQQVQSVFVILVSADSGTAEQLLLGVLRSQRIVPVLLEISAGNDSHQLVIFINNWQLAWKQRKNITAYFCRRQTLAQSSAADQEQWAGRNCYKMETQRCVIKSCLVMDASSPGSRNRERTFFVGLEKDSVFLHQPQKTCAFFNN
ncbi:hypothetical protein Nmel_012748 [Mimus melanotis]